MVLCLRLLTAAISGFLLLAVVPPASAQAPPPSLAQERAAAKATGLELSSVALSPLMPPASENAALIYKKLGDEANARARADVARIAAILKSQDDSTPRRGRQSEEQLLEQAFHQLNTLTVAEWDRVRVILGKQTPYIEAIRTASRKPKFVVAPNEFVPALQGENAADLATTTGAAMREEARLMVSESIWEAHAGHPADAIRDLTLGLRMAHHEGSYNTATGYLVAEAIYGLNVSGFKAVLRMYAGNPAVCRAVQAALTENFSRPPLSATLKVELAIGLDTVDELLKAGPEDLSAATGKSPLSKQEYVRFLDEFAACNLRLMREAIPIVDAPSATSAPILGRLTSEINKKYPENGMLPPTYGGSPDLPFHRDTMNDNVRTALAGASVLIYHAEHHAYPKTLADAMPSPPADAFDGKPLQYEVTATGFVISATHQRPGHAPEPARFRYPL